MRTSDPAFFHRFNSQLHDSHRADCNSYAPSQADVAVFKQLKEAPAAEKYTHAYRWYKHIATVEAEFSSLPGDPSKAATAYGPESSELTVNTAGAPEKKEEDDDDVDLFGSDDEEEDAEAERIKAERVAAYQAKKANKPKTVAKVRLLFIFPSPVLRRMYRLSLACMYDYLEYDVDFLCLVCCHPRGQALG